MTAELFTENGTGIVDLAADDVGRDLLKGEALFTPEGEPDLDTAAVLLDAARALGWKGADAKEILVSAGIEWNGEEEWAAIERKAGKVADPWRWLTERTSAGHAAVLKRVLSENAPASNVEPTELDLDAPPKAPEWIVEGILAKRKRLMISGDQSASKSTVVGAIVAAGLSGGTFLGQPVNARRFLVIDGEQDAEQIVEKWRPLGVRNEHLANLKLFGRGSGKLLGTPEGNAWIAEVVDEFRPDVIVLDTTGATAAVKGFDNDDVAALYRETLNPLIDRTGAALLYTHHERKSGGGGDRSAAALGARQWSNQADYHVTLATAGTYAETPLKGGHVATRRAFVMRRPKVRNGAEDRPTPFEVRGEKDCPEGATLKLEIVTPKREFTDTEQLAAACDAEITRKGLAARLEWGGDGTGKRFVNALDDAQGAKLIEQLGRGRYGPGEART